ncbi:MAG: hypothetical protein FJ027_17340 [Candidatus Rokubacteria bacterium]|nr:hypothetical protein [Candidatus Rokubacteria bacterium]
MVVPDRPFIRLRAHVCRQCRTNDTVRAPALLEPIVLVLTGRRRYRCRSCNGTFWRRARSLSIASRLPR